MAETRFTDCRELISKPLPWPNYRHGNKGGAKDRRKPRNEEYDDEDTAEGGASKECRACQR